MMHYGRLAHARVAGPKGTHVLVFVRDFANVKAVRADPAARDSLETRWYYTPAL